MTEKSLFKRLTGKLYGGLPMTWPVVLLFAAASAALTAFFLIVPAFENTSFARMGVTLEAWVFFAVLILLLTRPQLALDTTQFLPDDPVLTAEASVTVEDSAFASVSVARSGPDSMVRIQAGRYGRTSFTIQDGEDTYRYTLIIYEDDAGHAQIRIEPA